MKMHISLEITFDLDYIEERQIRNELIKIIDKAYAACMPMTYTARIVESDDK